MTGNAEQITIWLIRQGKPDKLYEIKEHKERRSLDSNSYYWVLVSKLAQKLHMSAARIHNTLLRDVAPPYLIDGRVAMQPIPDTDEAESQVIESSTYHLKPTSGTIEGKDGQVYRWYIILRGSSSFNKEEMSALIERVIAECKEQDIETATPAELAIMADLWVKRHEAQKEKSDGDTAQS